MFRGILSQHGIGQNVGRIVAEGTVLSSSTQQGFQYLANTQHGQKYFAEVTDIGLGDEPSLILLYPIDSTNSGWVTLFSKNKILQNYSDKQILNFIAWGTGQTSTSSQGFKAEGYSYVTKDGFKLPVGSQSVDYKFIVLE